MPILAVAPAYEAQLMSERRQRDDRVTAMADRMRPHAGAIADMANRYPYARPGVIAGMGMIGLPPDSPDAEELANMSLEESLQRLGRFDLAPDGTTVNVGSIRQEYQQADANMGQPAPPEPGMGGIGGFLKGTLRTGMSIIGGAYGEISAAASSLGEAGLDALIHSEDDDDEGFWSDLANNFTTRAAPSTLRLAMGEWWRNSRQGDWSMPLYDQEYAGSGFFPYGGELGETIETQKQNLKLPGTDEFVTPGRLLPFVINHTTGLLEPGTQQFNFASGLLDVAANIWGDPLNYLWGVGAIDEVGDAARIASNIPDAIRPLGAALREAPIRGRGIRAVAANPVDYALSGGNAAGNQLIDTLTQTTDTGDLIRLFSHKADPHILRQIADSTDPQEVLNLTRENLGLLEMPRGLRGPRMPEVARNWWDRPTRQRIASEVPGGGTGYIRMDLRDPTAVVKGFDDWGLSWKGTVEQRNSYINEFLDLGPLGNDPASYLRLRPLMTRMMTDAADAVHHANPNAVKIGRKPIEEVVDELTQFGADYLSQGRKFNVDHMGRQIIAPGMHYRVRRGGDWTTHQVKPGQTITLIDGKVEAIPTADALMFAQNNNFFLPNTEQLVRATGRFAAWKNAKVPILNTRVPGGVVTESLHDWYLGKIQPWWQQVTILKPALLLRNMMENTFSLAAEGYVNAGTRSLDYAAAVGGMGAKGLDGDWMRNYEGLVEKAQGIGGLIDESGRSIPGTLRAGRQHWDDVSARDGEKFWTSWARRLIGFHQDQGYRTVASVGVDDLGRWALQDPAGQAYMRHLDEMTGAGKGFQFEGNQQAIREWADARLAGMNDMGGTNRDVMAMIASGKFGGIDATGDRLELKDFRAIGEYLRDNYKTAAPSNVPGRVDLSWDKSLEHQDRGFLGQIFHSLVQVPEEKLAYIPTYSMAHWDEVRRLLPWATDDVRTAVLKSVQDNDSLIRTAAAGDGVPTRILNQFFNHRGQKVIDGIHATANNGHNAIDTVDDFFKLVKSNSAERLSDVLLDVTKRSRFFEGLRFFMPFAHVYYDVMRRWTRRLNPATAVGRRQGPYVAAGLQRAVTDLQESDPFDFEFLGGDGDFTEGPGKGFFYLDNNGNNVFAYPSAAMFTAFAGGTIGALAGGPIGAGVGAAIGGVGGAIAQGVAGDKVDLNMTANPAALNLVASSPLPGFGPTVQVPASFLLRGEASDSKWRELLLPYGEVDEATDLVVPPAYRKILDAVFADPDTDAELGNLMWDVAAGLMASGEYGDANTLMTQAGQERLLSEARSRARILMGLRGFAQLGAPAAPRLEFRGVTDAGTFTFNVLSQEMRKLRDEYGPDEGQRAFIEIFGSEWLAAVQPKTQTVNNRSVSSTGADWERDHRELAEALPEVIGFFAPSDPDAPIDFRAYEEQIRRDDRDQLSPRQISLLYNDVAGRIILRNERTRLGELADTAAGKAELRRIRGDLMARYPGFDQVEGIQRRVSTETVVARLADAMTSEELQATQTGQALTEWLPAYTSALAAMEGLGFATLVNESQEATYLRIQLRELGNRLVKEFPDFADLWSRHLMRLVATEDERATGVGGGE